MNEQDLMDKTVETVETAIEAAKQTEQIVKNNPVLLAGVGVISLAVGAAASYFLVKKRLEIKYEAILVDEIVKAERHYARQFKAEEFSTPAAAVEALVPVEDYRDIREEIEQESAVQAATALRDYAGMHKGSKKIKQTKTETEVIEITDAEAEADAEAADEVRAVTKNIFRDGQELDDEDLEDLGPRTEDYPFIVSTNEFYNDAEGFEVEMLTYFAGDDTLLDSAEERIDDIDKAVGDVNLQYFGRGSGDPNILFVRNEARKMQYEIALDKGSYTEKVLGFRDDGDGAVVRRKFRESDD